MIYIPDENTINLAENRALKINHKSDTWDDILEIHHTDRTNHNLDIKSDGLEENAKISIKNLNWGNIIY